MAHARKQLDWGKQFELAITTEKAQEIYNKRKPADPGTCTMCGEYCAIKIVNNLFTECSLV